MKQNGNVLFLILIAVGLFAALGYAITKSSDGSGKDTTAEKAQLKEATNNNCASNIESTVMRLTMMNGCSPETLSYELPSGSNANPNAPANKTCHVFNAAGGGAYPCGAYAIEGIVTGPIAPGDTTTIARASTGFFLKCTWGRGTSCYPHLSTDGVNFSDYGKLCLKKADGIDPSRGNDGPPGSTNFLCRAICGTSTATSTAFASGIAGSGDLYYLGDDLNITPFTGSCQSLLGGINCSC